MSKLNSRLEKLEAQKSRFAAVSVYFIDVDGNRFRQAKDCETEQLTRIKYKIWTDGNVIQVARKHEEAIDDFGERASALLRDQYDPVFIHDGIKGKSNKQEAQ